MNKLVSFFYEVVAELRKVTWPKRDDVVGSVIIVLIFVFCFAIILGAFDVAFAEMIKKLLGGGGLL